MLDWKHKRTSEENYGEYGFPYISKDVAYILIEKSTGFSWFIESEFTNDFKREILSAVQKVENEEATLLAVWKGFYTMKVYVVDTLAKLKKAINAQIKGTVSLCEIDFDKLKEKYTNSCKCKEERKRIFHSNIEVIDTLLDGLEEKFVDKDGYYSVSEIEELTKPFYNSGKLRNVFREYKVPLKYEQRKINKSYRSIQCFLMSESIKAIRKDAHKFDYLFQPH